MRIAVTQNYLPGRNDSQLTKHLPASLWRKQQPYIVCYIPYVAP
jgi:hypothetical protein